MMNVVKHYQTQLGQLGEHVVPYLEWCQGITALSPPSPRLAQEVVLDLSWVPDYDQWALG